MKLKEILAKEAKDLSSEEKAFLKENVESLDDAQKSKFAEAIKDEEGLDEEGVKTLLSAAMEKQMDAIAESLVTKFHAGIEEQRVKAAADNGKNAKSDEKVRKFMKALLNHDRAAAKALTTDVAGTSPDDTHAGLTIPTELMNEVLRIAEKQYGLARRDMRYLPFSGPGNERIIPTLGTAVQVFWTGEGSKKKSTQPKFDIVTQTLKKLAAIVPMTEEILEDSAINLTSLLGELFAEAVAKEEDMQFFSGDGNPWTGILNNGNVNIVNCSGVGGAPTADDLLDMTLAVATGARAGSKFYFNPSVFGFFQKLKDLNGNYILQTPTGDRPGTIWNYPYELSDAFPAIGDVSDGVPFVLFGNLKVAAVFGDKQQIRVKLLEEGTITDTDDQTSINLAEQDMVALRIVERVGYVLALPEAVAVLYKGTGSSS